MIAQACVTLLAIIAAWVAVRQWKYGDRDISLTWALITAYWVVLTVKNINDMRGMMLT